MRLFSSTESQNRGRFRVAGKSGKLVIVIVILDLHDLVTDGKGRPVFLDLWVFARIESPLQLDIQRTGAKSAAVPRAKHLDVAHRIEAEPAGDALLDEFDEPRGRQYPAPKPR
jgi:hypothetical protein